jgi:hypothetical protein
MKEAKPCDVCGTTGGKVSRGCHRPSRRSLAIVGLEGRACFRCWQRYYHRHRRGNPVEDTGETAYGRCLAERNALRARLGTLYRRAMLALVNVEERPALALEFLRAAIREEDTHRPTRADPSTTHPTANETSRRRP